VEPVSAFFVKKDDMRGGGNRGSFMREKGDKDTAFDSHYPALPDTHTFIVRFILVKSRWRPRVVIRLTKNTVIHKVFYPELWIMGYINIL